MPRMPRMPGMAGMPGMKIRAAYRFFTARVQAKDKNGAKPSCPPHGDTGMKNVAAAQLQCETGQEEKHV